MGFRIFNILFLNTKPALSISKILICCLLLNSLSIFGQDSIILQNPSLEWTPKDDFLPPFWQNCGFVNKSLPNIHPQPRARNITGVVKEPKAGMSYISLLVENDGTWQGIGQPLPKKMEAGRCYVFSADMARAPAFEIKSMVDQNPIQYIHPVTVRIWGGSLEKKRTELLASVGPIRSLMWNRFTFLLQPKEDHSWFLIEAYYAANHQKYYNGNVLIDNCSAIKRIACDDPKYAYLNEPLAEEFFDLIDLYWEDLHFIFGSAEMNHKHRTLLTSIIGNFSFDEEEELVIAVADGLGSLRQNRLTFLNKLMRRCGVPIESYRVTSVLPSDLSKDWLAKNHHLWVRLD